MGIAPYKYFTFDGVSSRNYDVYLTGTGVFNAPQRAVELLEIPGRNGNYALDQGRFNNITVTYKAGIVDVSESNFADKVSAVRNWLCSKVGYKRLSDDYNPNEYRMAVYKSGVNIDHVDLKTGEFEITFECKPQRWLTSGEEAVTIGEWGETETVSGDVVEIEATDTDAVKSLVADIVPIQSGSGTPSPQNIRPISGTDSVSVTRCGNNLLDIANATLSRLTLVDASQGKVKANISSYYYGSITLSGANFPLPIKQATLNGTPITVQADNNNGKRISILIYGTRTNGTSYQEATEVASNSVTITPTLFTSVSSLEIRILRDTAQYTDTTTEVSGLRLSVGDSGMDFEPFGNTYTTTLPSTTYGGTLDLVSGLLTVTDGYIASYNGETLPSTWISDRDVYASGTTPTTGAQVVYKLATPTTTTLTPQQVELLLGTNNIWADSGDVTIEYGQNPSVLINPTPFEAEPLLAVDGYGTIGFNGYEVEINNEPLGVITLVGEEKYTSPIQLDLSNVNTGDDIILQLERTRFSVTLDGLTSKTSNYVFDPCVDSNSDFSSAFSVITAPTVTSYTRNIAYQTNIAEPLTFKKGTSKTITNTVTSSFQCKYNGTTYTVSFSVTESIAYNGTTHEITMSTAGTVTTTLSGTQSVTQDMYFITSIMADSTKSAVADSIFIDCEIGECWTIQGGNIISLNGLITLGSDLPKLASGTNTFTYDNTVTQLEVQPRWWKV